MASLCPFVSSFPVGEKGDSKGEEVFCDVPSSVFHTSNGPPKRDRAQPVRLSTVIPTVTCALVQDTRSPIVTIPNTRYPSTLPVRRCHVFLSLFVHRFADSFSRRHLVPARDKGIAVAAKLEMLIPASAGRYASREDERRGVEKG